MVSVRLPRVSSAAFVLSVVAAAGVAAGIHPRSVAASAASAAAAAPCTFAHGLQTGPWTRRVAGGLLISLRIENTRGRAACRFRNTVDLALLGDETRLLLPVRGNPTRLVAVNRVVPRRAVLDLSWVWRNWCRPPLRAVGSIESTSGAGPPAWVSLFRSPGCRDRGRPSTLAFYGATITRLHAN
jgi:hypothetical protein